jgi:hypothetical protein
MKNFLTTLQGQIKVSFTDLKNILFQKNTNQTVRNFPNEQYTFFVPSREFGYSELKSFFRSVSILRRGITDLASAVINQQDIPNKWDPLAKKAVIHLLLYGLVIVRKPTVDNQFPEVFDPEYCEYYTSSYRDHTLVGLVYRLHDSDYTWYYADELAIITLDNYESFPGFSVLEGIAPELRSFNISRQIMETQYSGGNSTRLAMILDNKGLNGDQMESERKNIKATVSGSANADKTLVAFSPDAKGQIIELKNAFVTQDHIAFFEYFAVSVATSLGIPRDYMNATHEGSGLSDSRFKVSDYVYNQTIKNLQSLVKNLFFLLGIDDYQLSSPISSQDLLLMEVQKANKLDSLSENIKVK